MDGDVLMLEQVGWGRERDDWSSNYFPFQIDARRDAGAPFYEPVYRKIDTGIPEDVHLQNLAANIVNELFELAGMSVEWRQAHNDEADAFVRRLLDLV